jgi:DNA-binding CsgD family transcriptional regulator
MSDAALPSREKELASAIDCIYAAVEQPELWPETIGVIGRLVGGGSHFWSVDSGFRAQRNQLASEAACHGTFLLSRSDLRALDQYALEFEKLIVRFLSLVFLSILWSQNDVGPREALGARMVRRYLSSQEASRRDSHSARRLIGAMWEEGRMFELQHLEHMQLLAPHLDRAVRLQMRFNLVSLRSELVSGALDRLTVGVILVDQGGSVMWHNRRAAEIATDTRVLSFSGSRLVGRDAAVTQSIRELIARAVDQGDAGLLPITRSDSRPVLLVATPLKPDGMYDFLPERGRSRYSVVFITDPDRSDNLSVESLRRAFDLTYREAQTAIAVAHGHGLKTAARAMGVAPTTARSQLQQVFAKTGTSHQAELAALVHRTVTHVR